MEVLTTKSTRRCTRLRVEIPVTVTSLDRKHPLAAECLALVISPQGCGVRATQPLPVKTPVLLSNLPGGASASAHVASCLPLGKDGKYFLIGLSLYNSANIWGIKDPPKDWNSVAAQSPDQTFSQTAAKGKGEWPYNLFSAHGETHPEKK
jgi:hypothetical protein